MRVLIWVQHLRGVGHLRRMTRIADALGTRGAQVTLVSGGLPVPEFERGAFALRRLTPVRARDARYCVLIDEAGRTVDDSLIAKRANDLCRLLTETAPDVIVTELFPFGRRKFLGELLPFLEAARARRPRPLILASLRDIPEPPRDASRSGDRIRLAHEFYDSVLVHGDPDFLPLAEAAPGLEGLRLPIHYTGYVAAPALEAGERPALRRAEIIVSAGGGRGSAALPAMAARAALMVKGPEPLRWRLIGGRHGDDTITAAGMGEQRGGNNSGCEIVRERNRDDLPELMREAVLSISRAGYNSVAEALQTRTRMILVPDNAGGQQEQTMRATRLARDGLAFHLPESRLTPESLAQAVMAQLSTPRPRHGIDLNGAAASADLVTRLCTRHRAEQSVARRKDPG